MDPDTYLVAVRSLDASAPATPAGLAGLRLAHTGSELSVWVSAGASSLRITAIAPSAILIGDVFASQAGAGEAAEPFDLASLRGLSVDAMAEQLIETGWGRYILVNHTEQATAVLRDPSGALDCLTWRSAGVRFFAGRLPHDLDPLLPMAISIDWPTVARQLREPLAVSGASALRNIETIAPGAVWIATAGGMGEVRQVWRPAAIARRGRDDVGDPARALRSRVQTCVATLAKPHQRIIAEISGGLDSAIVAAALSHSTREQSAAIRWINYATDDLEGDERAYARAVACELGIDLIECHKPPLRYDQPRLSAIGADFRVGLTALDPDYDADVATQALDHQADALMTGQGGDVVFLQMATAAALADRLRLRGEIDVSQLLAHSRRWRRSVWRTLGTTVAQATWPRTRRRPERSYLGEGADPSDPAHPWLADLRGLSSAKAAQIQALTASQNVFGPSRRSRTICCLHPLLSQPVVELALSLPSFALTRGGEDRALARSAFADRLPQILRDRRSKGSLQAFYGRAVAASLDVLRPWLLEGVLAHEELIRTDRLERLLDPDVLIMKDLYVELLHVAAIEAWVRGWTDRIAAIKSRTALVASPNSRQGT